MTGTDLAFIAFSFILAILCFIVILIFRISRQVDHLLSDSEFAHLDSALGRPLTRWDTEVVSPSEQADIEEYNDRIGKKNEEDFVA